MPPEHFRAAYRADEDGKSLDADHAFKVCAAYDAHNLYVRYDVTSRSPLTNAIPDPQMIFKGGNLLDIQIATDPMASPRRTTPAPGGDLLIMIYSQRHQKSPTAERYLLRGTLGRFPRLEP